MIIYNVTVKVDVDIADNWATWMKEEHIPDLLQTGKIQDARLCRLIDDQPGEDAVTYVAQYSCATMNDYNAYIDEYATEMRERAFKAWGNKFVAFRTVMEVL